MARPIPAGAPSSRLLLVQLAGSPGTGKSVLASALGRALGAVVLDRDVVNSALLDADVGWGGARAPAHEVMCALAASLLEQGLNVVLDSPSDYAASPQRGLAVARDRGADYRFIECVCEDLEEVGRRLAGRMVRRSQWTGIDVQSPDGITGAELVGPRRWRTYGPEGGWLILDTGGRLEMSLAPTLGYLAAP
ncbi:MAG TPA: AAA family ATPase [Candidatus Dormibacteraeota bacterium]|nr:AAA family ATPase [Candidatus Dormibacteraeota bacterium]